LIGIPTGDGMALVFYKSPEDHDQAMNWLEKAFAKGQPDLNTIRFDI
jgi:hypothetical protein